MSVPPASAGMRTANGLKLILVLIEFFQHHLSFTPSVPPPTCREARVKPLRFRLFP